MKRTKVLGISSLLVATVIYSFFGVLSRYVGFSIPLYFQTALRSLVTSIIVVLIIIAHKKWTKVTIRDWLWISARSFFGTVAIVCFFVAVNFLNIGTTYFIFFAGSTIGGYGMGKLLFRERLTKEKAFSLILSIVGLYLIYSFSIDATKIVYVVLALAAGFTAACWNTFSKKISDNYSPIQLTFLDNILSVGFALLLSMIQREVWVTPTLTTPWIANFIFGLLYVATGQLVIYGFKHLEAQIGSLIMLFQVVFGLILGLLWYKETISLTTFIGGMIVVIAVILPELKQMVKRKRTT